MPHYTIEIVDHRSPPLVDHDFLELAIRRVLEEQQIDSATISVALVTDAEIHELNRQYLGHDYPTDVISFLLDEPLPVVHDDERSESTTERLGTAIFGELIVSNETAIREAGAHGWSPHAELLLYVVHGLLHLCGYDDLTDEARPVMRARERELLGIWGFCPTGLEP